MQPSRLPHPIAALLLATLIATNAADSQPSGPSSLVPEHGSASAESGPASARPHDEWANDSAASEQAREEFARQVERNVDELENTMSTARRAALALDSSSQRVFLRVSRDVGAAARELHRSLETARRARGGDWEKARATVASDYETYAQAVAQAQRIAVLGTSSASRGLTLDAR